MEIEQVAEMARTVAWLPKAERDFFDGMVAEQSAMAAEAYRIAKLRRMSNEDAVKAALMNMCDSIRWREVNFPKFMKDLEDAGFVRLTDSDEGAVELACRLMRNSPRVRMLMGAEAAGALCGELVTRDAAVAENDPSWWVALEALARKLQPKAFS